MNRNPTGVSPKNHTPSCSNISTSKNSYLTSKTKNVSSSTTTSTSSYKPPHNATTSLQSNKNIVVSGTDHNTRGPTTSTIEHTSRIATKTPLPQLIISKLE